jgi:hypothetical protein
MKKWSLRVTQVLFVAAVFVNALLTWETLNRTDSRLGWHFSSPSAHPAVVTKLEKKINGIEDPAKSPAVVEAVKKVDDKLAAMEEAENKDSRARKLRDEDLRQRLRDIIKNLDENLVAKN